MAKSFTHEDEMVKLQTMNLAAKLWFTNHQECELLVRHVMQLARFDQSYDIRDRCRFLRNLLFSDNKLSAFANEIFITEKPSPTTQSTFKGEVIVSLSLQINLNMLKLFRGWWGNLEKRSNSVNFIFLQET